MKAKSFSLPANQANGRELRAETGTLNTKLTKETKGDGKDFSLPDRARKIRWEKSDGRADLAAGSKR